MTYDAYLLLSEASFEKNTRWRRGQTYFNTLWEIRPDLSEVIRGTPLDPYHVDERLSDFLEFVQRNW